ncbi:MAG: tetratricopeptide repeat-containing sensor histidine kinase [Cyclobacteriaceae bacterium]
MKYVVSALFACFFSLQILAQDHRKVDSLRNVLTTGSDSLRYDALFELFIQYARSNTDSAVYFSDLSLKTAFALADSAKMAKSFHAIGTTKANAGRLREGINEMEIGLGIAKRNGFRDRTKFILNSLALANTRVGNYDVALDYNFESLRIREEEGDLASISISLNNIGLVYLEMSDYENALEYFKRSYDMQLETGNLDDVVIRITNMGYCYSGLGQYEKAIGAFQEAFEICGQTCRKSMLVVVHNALGNGYHKTGNLEDAIGCHQKAIMLAREIGAPRDETIGFRAISEIKLEQGIPELALQFLDSAQRIAESTDLKIELLENTLVFSKIYSALGDYQKSSSYQQKYIELNREIFSGELIQKISRITSDYSERENLKTIAAKDQVLLLQEEIIARQRSQYFFIITITALIVGLALVLYWSNRKQRKANAALAEAKATIERQNALLQDANHALEEKVIQRTQELHSSNESLRRANEEMDNFIYKTSHDIRGPLASLKGICNVALMDVKDPVALDYFHKLDVSSIKLNNTLSRLLIINQINQSALTSEPIDLIAKIEGTLSRMHKNGVPERMEITYEVSEGVAFNSDRALVEIVLENLIENAIKFYNKSDRVQPFVKILATEEQDFVVIKVIDNGIGIDERSREHIFELFIRASERSESGGIGLYLSKLAVTKLGGTIDFLSTAEGFTEFTVRLPKDLKFESAGRFE